MAFTTSALGLTIWNAPTDKYNYQQLADNWLKVEDHDHAPGKGKLIQTDSIATGAVTIDKIAPGVISTQSKSVGTDALVNKAVTTAKIADEAVTYGKIHPYARMPIGAIVPWWHPTPTEATLIDLFGKTPSWVICDGRTLTAGHHDLGTDDFTVPNLQSKFIMCASDFGDQMSIEIVFDITTSTAGSKTFRLASSTGLQPNRTYSIIAPTIFPDNTTFTTGSTLTAPHEYTATNFAKISMTTANPSVSVSISTNPDSVGYIGGQNTNSFAHSHTFSHTHTVPPHSHLLVGAATGNLQHTHKNENNFVVAAGKGPKSNSNFVTKAGTAHRYAQDSTSGPMEPINNNAIPSGQQYPVSGKAGAASLNGDSDFPTGPAITVGNTGLTGSGLSDFDNRPSYISIMHIMKVRN